MHASSCDAMLQSMPALVADDQPPTSSASRPLGVWLFDQPACKAFDCGAGGVSAERRMPHGRMTLRAASGMHHTIPCYHLTHPTHVFHIQAQRG